MRSAMLLAVLLFVPITHSAAQRSLTLVRGQRARVTAPALGAYHHELRYVGSFGDTLMFSADTVLAVPLADVVRLEILKGQRSYKWPGAAIGLGCGALVGVGIGYAVTTDGSGNWDFSRPMAVMVGGVAFGVIGTGVGAWVGLSIRTDQWRDVPLEGLRVSVAPVRSGLSVGARITF